MPKSIVVCGAGPGLGQAVAHRYAKEGFTVALVARRFEPLQRLADELVNAGATAHAITADLSDTDAVPELAEQIRGEVGNVDALYYGPTAGRAVPATDLTAQHLAAVMPLALYTLVALVGEFLPHMIEQRDGAILIATGASAVQGMANLSGPGPGLAAQRNYLQSLEAEVAPQGIYVGRLYIGATIEHSAWHARIEADKAAGRPTWARGPVVNPADLADQLWTMHNLGKQPEAIYPEDTFSR
jgi:NADP-dependent 3-hydroxy acid dehydrogenase YdfG